MPLFSTVKWIHPLISLLNGITISKNTKHIHTKDLLATLHDISADLLS